MNIDLLIPQTISSYSGIKYHLSEINFADLFHEIAQVSEVKAY